MSTSSFEKCRARVALSRQRTAESKLTLPTAATVPVTPCAKGPKWMTSTCAWSARLTAATMSNPASWEDARKEWGQTGYMILSAIIQYDRTAVLYGKDDPVPAEWTPIFAYASVMGNLADYVMDCERNVKQEGLSQTLGWAFLHWRWYCDLRGWTVEYLTFQSGESASVAPIIALSVVVLARSYDQRRQHVRHDCTGQDRPIQVGRTERPGPADGQWHPARSHVTSTRWMPTPGRSSWWRCSRARRLIGRTPTARNSISASRSSARLLLEDPQWHDGAIVDVV